MGHSNYEFRRSIELDTLANDAIVFVIHRHVPLPRDLGQRGGEAGDLGIGRSLVLVGEHARLVHAVVLLPVDLPFRLAHLVPPIFASTARAIKHT